MKTAQRKLAIAANQFEGFSKLSFAERSKLLVELGFLTKEEIQILHKDCSLSSSMANQFIENVIGCFPIPLGVAVNFFIDQREYIIPMAVEETSIVAGASKTAKWIREEGEITTKTLGQLGIGQIQIPKVTNFKKFKQQINAHKDELIAEANSKVAKGIVARGGGLRDIQCRCVARGDGQDMAVVHVMIDTRDAMGANIINQVCEFLKPSIERLTGQKVGLCILSNLADTKLTQAKVMIYNIDPELGHAIAEASLFASVDPYRAATNNKGVLNGIDPILVATGNDWRAVEAGVHAYAAYSGQYKSITQWWMQGKNLVGLIEAPILVGTVGGVTQIHPVAQVCLKMLNVKNSAELARIIAAVGLVQNLGALKALATQGIIAGHMKLHLSNLVLHSNATQKELPVLIELLRKRLEKQKHITGTDVREILDEMRKQ